MQIEEPVAEFNRLLSVVLLVTAFLTCPDFARASTAFRLEKDPQGSIRPFRAISVPLADFVREFSSFTSTAILVRGNWDNELKGTVTLLMRKSLKSQELTEVFHRVLNDNGYAVVDAPAANGWVIQPTRDARDAALPIYEMSEVPDSNRFVTAHWTLKFADSEVVARLMRSFMPANSRIIPATRSQVLVTDTASNIRRIKGLIERMDTAEAAKRQRESGKEARSSPEGCGEKRIEKLVVENLEIREGGAALLPTKPLVEGGKK